MQIWRTVESLIVVEGKDSISRLLMTLGCGHSINMPIDYFRNRTMATNRSGKNVFRCPRCEELWTPPEGGPAA